MAEYPALPLWTDAFLADTVHLDAIETGAYICLLIAAWRSPGCRLPDDDKRLARYARCGLKTWRRIRPTVIEFWTVEHGYLTQKRLMKEMAYLQVRSDKNRAAANTRWRDQDVEKTDEIKRRGSQREGVDDKGEAHVASDKQLINLDTDDANASPRDMRQPCPHTYTYSKKKFIEPDGSTNIVKSSALDPVLLAVEKYNDMASRCGLPKAQKITKARKAAIGARLKDGGGIDGWQAALDKVEAQTWLHGDNDRGWKANLDFIAGEQSFTKLMEGTYDRDLTDNQNAAGGRSTDPSLAAALNRVFDAESH